jgi:hypothetical protein
MGCPDAVRIELLKLTGVLVVTYHPGQDRFAVRFESVLVGLEKIMATVSLAGARLGKVYVPEMVPLSSD